MLTSPCPKGIIKASANAINDKTISIADAATATNHMAHLLRSQSVFEKFRKDS